MIRLGLGEELARSVRTSWRKISRPAAVRRRLRTDQSATRERSGGPSAATSIGVTSVAGLASTGWLPSSGGWVSGGVDESLELSTMTWASAAPASLAGDTPVSGGGSAPFEPQAPAPT